MYAADDLEASRLVHMAPKKAPTPFEVDGVQCTVKDGLINAGLNDGVPRDMRFLTKVKATASLEEAKTKVREHGKFAAVAAHVAADAQPSLGARSRSGSPDAPEGRSIKVGIRELASLRELNES